MTQSVDRGKRARWEALLRQFPSSGLSVREFCRRRGVSEPSFYGWRRRLDGAGTGRRGGPGDSGDSGAACGVPLFLPVRVASPAPPAGATRQGAEGSGGPGWIELVLRGGVTVRVLGEVPAARLAAVLGVLQQSGENAESGESGGIPC